MKPSHIELEQIAIGPYQNFAYLVADRESKMAVIFDPAWETETLLSKLRDRQLQLRYIINTHAHFDHIQGNQEMKGATGAQIIMHESSLAKKDIGVRDGDIINVSEGLSLKFVHTPGHSPESMCVIVGDYALITGDTLFIGECGRVDLPGGDAGQLFDSFEKLRKLDSGLLLYPGHDYGPVKYSTLGEQIESNYTLARRGREEFIQFMNQP